VRSERCGDDSQQSSWSHPKQSSGSDLDREPIGVAVGWRVFDASLSAEGLAVMSVCNPSR
jgi:hypothetical protein